MNQYNIKMGILEMDEFKKEIPLVPTKTKVEKNRKTIVKSNHEK